MTSQKDQIQTLITEIDSVLQKANPRLPWAGSGETTQQRQVLERVRNYLVSFHQRLATEEGGVGPITEETLLGQDFYYQPPQAFSPPQARSQMVPFQAENLSEQSTHHLMQALLEEIRHLRAALAHPPLNQQQFITELVQVLMSRLGTLTASPPLPQYEHQSFHLQASQSRSDQMLMSLDSALNIIFESLQRNIQSYHESLSQGVERMYTLGQQSEVAFKGLVELLTQQLQQEASVYQLSSSQVGSQMGVSAPSAPNQEAGRASRFSVPSGDASIESLDSAIDSWLRSASHLNFDARNSDVASLAPGDLDFESGDLESDDLAGLGLAPLDLSHLELAPIELEAIAQPSETMGTETLGTKTLDTETLGNISGANIAEVNIGDTASANVTDVDTANANIDATLKFLEELNAELEEPATPLSQDAAMQEAEAQWEEMLSTAQLSTAQLSMAQLSTAQLVPEETHPSPTVSASESVSPFQDEVDEFYQSLFGQPETAAVELPESLFEDVSESGSEMSTASVELPESLFEDSAESASELSTASVELPAIDLPDSLFEAAVEQAPEHFTQGFTGGSIEQSVESAVVLPPPPSVESIVERAIGQSGDGRSRDGRSRTEPFGAEQSLEATTETNLLEDQYTRAGPDENLLPNAPMPKIDLNLALDEMTLTNLSEDLSGFETFANQTNQFGGEFGAPFASSSFTAIPSTAAASTEPVFAVPENLILPEDLTSNTAAADTTEVNTAAVDTTQTKGLAESATIEYPSVQYPATESPIAESLAIKYPSVQHPVTETPVTEAPVIETPATEAPVAETPVAEAAVTEYLPTPPPTAEYSPVSLVELSPSLSPSPQELGYGLAPGEFRDLFGDSIPGGNLGPTPTVESIRETPFTLEGMDDLFGDVPATRSASSPVLPDPMPLTSPLASTQQPLPFTLEGMDDLFNEAPGSDRPNSSDSPASSVREAPPKGIPVFKPQTFSPNYIGGEPPQFSLEQLDNLFVEPSSETVPEGPSPQKADSTVSGTADSGSPAFGSPASDATTSEGPSQAMNLDQAFESVTGISPQKSSPSPPPQKRKQGNSKKKRPR